MKLVPFALPSSASTMLSADASLQCTQEGYRLEFSFHGTALRDIALPEPVATPIRRDELWKHTCFEAFFAPADGLHYYEFNGSLSGDWAFYRFDDYRAGMQAQALATAPQLRLCERQADSLRVVWCLPHFCTERLERAGITAILRTRTEPPTSSYWALAHAGIQPDFHLRDSFIAPLPTPPSTHQA